MLTKSADKGELPALTMLDETTWSADLEQLLNDHYQPQEARKELLLAEAVEACVGSSTPSMGRADIGEETEMHLRAHVLPSLATRMDVGTRRAMVPLDFQRGARTA